MRKFNLVIAGLVLAGLAVFLTVEGAEAFCVYNYTDVSIQVNQTSGYKTGGGFSAEITPIQWQDCCGRWEPCNEEGKVDSILRFNVEWYKTPMRGSLKTTETICKDFPIKAGGWLNVKGEKGKYQCEAGF